jgi:hypothetical protein
MRVQRGAWAGATMTFSLAAIGCAADQGWSCGKWDMSLQPPKIVDVRECNGTTDLATMIDKLVSAGPDVVQKVVSLTCSSATCGGEIPDSIENLLGLEYITVSGASLKGAINSKMINLPKLKWIQLANCLSLEGAVPSLANINGELGWINLAGSQVCGPWPNDAPTSSVRFNHATMEPFTGTPELNPSGEWPNPGKQVCLTQPPSTFSPSVTFPPTQPPSDPGKSTNNGQYCIEHDEHTGQVTNRYLVFPYDLPGDVLTLLSVIFACIGIVASIGGIIFVYIFRKRPIIQYSQKRFLGLSCIALLVLNISALAGALQLVFPDPALCEVKDWLFFSSLTVMICSLAFKNYRAYRVHQSTTLLRKIVITDKWLWVAIGAATSITMLFLIFNAAFFPSISDPCKEFVCTHTNPALVYTLYIYVTVLIIATVWVCCKARDVPSVGSESSGILYTVIFLFFAFVLILCVNNLNIGEASLIVWLNNFCLLWITAIALGFIVFRKAVWLKLDNDEIRKRFLSSKSHRDSSNDICRTNGTTSQAESRSDLYGTKTYTADSNLNLTTESTNRDDPQEDFDQLQVQSN